MSVFGQSKPAYLKTYGKQKRKVERWLSPDLRKKAFSSSSTPSSDQSIPELTSKKRKSSRKSTDSTKSRTLRMAKQKAMEALKEQESDESFFIPRTAPRRKPCTKLIKKSAVTSTSSGICGFASRKEEHSSCYTMRIRKKQPFLSNSENESNSFVTKNKCSNAFRRSASSNFKHRKESVGLPHADRFVTRRRRVLHIQSESHCYEQRPGISSNNLNTKDFICGLPSFPHDVTNLKQLTTQLESEIKPPDVLHIGGCCHSNTVFRRVSFDDEEQIMSCKDPLFCSTPSLISKRNLLCHEPSISEISSFSCDELDKHRPKNESTAAVQMSQPQKHTVLQKRKQYLKYTPKTEMVQQAGEYPNTQEQLRLEKRQTQSSIKYIFTLPHLKQVKERAVDMLEEDILDNLSNQGDEKIVGKTYSPRLKVTPITSVTAVPSCCGKQTCFISSDNPVSDASSKALHLTSSLSPPSFLYASSQSAPSTYVLNSSLQKQIDRLKVECLSSCLTISLQRLDLNAFCQVHHGIRGTHKGQFASPQSFETKRGQNARNLISTSMVNTESAGQSSGSELLTEGPVRQQSASFTLSDISHAPTTAPIQLPVLKEHNGLFTNRKVCVSGLNSKRWSKRGEQNRKPRQDVISAKPEDYSSTNLLPTGADSNMEESAYGWLKSSREIGFPKTLLREEQLNLSSFLACFTPDSLTTHSWGRLKAALSIHKKKKAFPTPRKLLLSSLRHPQLEDTSLELFDNPVPNQASSYLPLSSLTNTSMISCNEDISDAEKVYQECQQEGPIFFDDFISPECMKHCIKIGEGTFGEVFSIVSASQNVALKIIPVEGHQKVNGEPQKMFGEVLHEIIISKELSALNSKEYNKTSGFIGLLNLHCVRGCYPSPLLKAWDKFDQEKGSENDRPDFFGKEQLFLILEFEFGGSDLENMNGKLTSMAQAKSVLHQVTAALAVAEEALCFEHRDLHWGNVLVKNTKEKQNQFILNGSVHSIETHGVHANIIDYSLSRLEIDGLTVCCDIANEEDLFMGKGDYQFEVYRLMKKENNNCWSDYNPHSNVLWLQYLTNKLLTMKYRNKPQTSMQKVLKSSLKSFHSEVLKYHSAKDILLQSTLFQ